MVTPSRINGSLFDGGESKMIKSKFGPISNPRTNETKDIVVNALSKGNLKDFLIGGSIAMAGIFYVMLTAFRNGAEAFDNAECNVLKDLNLLDERK